MNVFGALWVGWLVYFAVVEAVAIVHSVRSKRSGQPNPTDTLSEHVWMWFGTAPGTQPDTYAYARRFMLVAFMAWLSVHFIGGGQLV